MCPRLSGEFHTNFGSATLEVWKRIVCRMRGLNHKSSLWIFVETDTCYPLSTSLDPPKETVPSSMCTHQPSDKGMQSTLRGIRSCLVWSLFASFSNLAGRTSKLDLPFLLRRRFNKWDALHGPNWQMCNWIGLELLASSLGMRNHSCASRSGASCSSVCAHHL